MCVGSELAGRSFPSTSTPTTTGTKLRNTKSTVTASGKPPLKQITGPESSHPLPLTPAASSAYLSNAKVSPSSAVSTPHAITGTPTSTQSEAVGIGDHGSPHPSMTPITPYIGDLSSQMDGVTLAHGSDHMDVTEGDDVQHAVVFPSSSPPPETYMDIPPKRSRKKRDRYPEARHGAGVAGATVSSGKSGAQQWQEHDLAPARISGSHPTRIEMMREIQQLRHELDNAKRQNDMLNMKMMRMAESAHVLNQLQQYMSHLKIALPDAASQTKDVVVGAPNAQSTSKTLTNAELKNLSPYAAFRDACVRYPGMPIVLFDLSTHIPVAILANEAFNSLFSTDAGNKPWVTFIAPTYLQRTKLLLNTASQHCAAMRFVQVYKDANQNEFVALDIHRFFATTSSTTGSRTFMDLVFLIHVSQLPYPTPEDLTYTPVAVIDGQIDLSQLFSSSSSSTSYAPTSSGHLSSSFPKPSSLGSSGGIAFHPSESGGLYDPDLNLPYEFGDPFAFVPSSSSPSASISSRIDDISSPSVVEVTTPPQDLPLGSPSSHPFDNLQQEHEHTHVIISGNNSCSSSPIMIGGGGGGGGGSAGSAAGGVVVGGSVSHLDDHQHHHSWLPYSGEPWSHDTIGNAAIWDPTLTWNPLTGSGGIVGTSIPPATSSSAMIEELASPTTPEQSPNRKLSPKSVISPHGSNGGSSSRMNSPHGSGGGPTADHNNHHTSPDLNLLSSHHSPLSSPAHLPPKGTPPSSSHSPLLLLLPRQSSPSSLLPSMHMSTDGILPPDSDPLDELVHL